MKIDYISDTHLNEYLELGNSSNEHLKKILLPMFENRQSDILIIAGDIGEDRSFRVRSFEINRRKHRQNIS